MRVRWMPSAERLLQQRDRFTQQAVKTEFETALVSALATQQRITFDHTCHGYLTSVADGRYSVVWYEEEGEAVVHAVVPTTRFTADADNLKAQVRSVVQRESHGAVDVK